jgi:hypothetical protein
MIGLSLNEARRARRVLRRSPAASLLIGSIALVLVGYLAAGIFATVPHLAFLYVHLTLLTALSRAVLSQRPRSRRPWHQPGFVTPGPRQPPAPAGPKMSSRAP